MFTAGLTVGLPKGVIDDTLLVSNIFMASGQIDFCLQKLLHSPLSALLFIVYRSAVLFEQGQKVRQ